MVLSASESFGEVTLLPVRGEQHSELFSLVRT